MSCGLHNFVGLPLVLMLHLGVFCLLKAVVSVGQSMILYVF